MKGGDDDETFFAFAGNEGGASLAAFDHQLRCLHVEIRLGGGLVVAGDAVVFEEGIDVPIIVEILSGERCRDEDKEEKKSVEHGVKKVAFQTYAPTKGISPIRTRPWAGSMSASWDDAVVEHCSGEVLELYFESWSISGESE